MGKQQATNGCVQASCKSITTPAAAMPMPSVMLDGPTNEPLTCIRQGGKSKSHHPLSPPRGWLVPPSFFIKRTCIVVHRSYDVPCFHSHTYNGDVELKKGLAPISVTGTSGDLVKLLLGHCHKQHSIYLTVEEINLPRMSPFIGCF